VALATGGAQGGSERAVTHLTVDVVHAIDQVDRAEWDALSTAHDPVSHRWLRLAEAVLLGHEPRYVLVRRSGRLEAGAVLSISRHFGHDALQRRVGWVLQLLPWLRCGVPLSSQPGILVRTEADPHGLLPALMRGVRDIAWRERAMFVTCGQFAPDDDLWLEIQRAGFHPHGRMTEVMLPIMWTSREEYLASLPGTHRRKIGKLERRAQREGIEVERLATPTAADAARLRMLITMVLEHHGSRDLYAPDFLERAATVCGADLHIVVARHSAETIGCVIGVRDGDALVAKWIGLDYARCWGTATYRALLDATVRLAIDLRVHRLALGPTAIETKLDYGGVAGERVGGLGFMAPVPAALVSRLAPLVAGRAAIDPTYSSARAD
jgi:predicted N-acyltransferase